MKITLSKKKRGEKRHVVLVCSPSEDDAIRGVIWNDVLEREARPVREHFRIDRVQKVRYRFSMQYLERLMLTFPFAEFSPGLEDQLSKAARREFESMTVPDIEIPDFNATLYDYQKIGVGKITENKRFLLNDEMGLGKTVQALASIVALEAYPALVVVPNSIKYNWEEMTERFTDWDVKISDGTTGDRRDQVAELDYDILVVNCESLRAKWIWDEELGEQVLTPRIPELFEVRWDMIVVDEYHRFKNPHAQMTLGLHMLKGKRKLGMSGTPVLNGRPEELWSILHWMWPRRYPDYTAFVTKHCVTKNGKVVAYRGLEELREFFNSKSLRRRKDQVLDDLPTVIHVDRYVDLTTEQRRLYNSIRDELLLWLDEEPRRIASVLAQITRLKQAAFSPELYEGSAESAKIEELKDIMRELTANGEKAIVFSQWSKATRIIQRELEEYNPAYVDGTVKARDRMAEVNKFNNDEDCKVFIGTVGSSKEGFTLSAATYVIFTDVGWVPSDEDQAIARSAAGGLRGLESGVDHVHVIYLHGVDTIEQRIHAMLQQKRQMNNRLTERDAGAKRTTISVSDIRDILSA